jgi:propionate CoA-transferase
MPAVISAEEAVRKVPDGGTVLVVPMPSEEIYPAFYRCFAKTGSPRDLTLVWAAGLGPFSGERQGMNHFAYPGMMKRLIAAHIGLNHEVMKMVAMNQCETFILPQGVLCQLYREIGAGRPGVLTRIGLGTFVDPRLDGGKVNDAAKACGEELVELLEIDGCELLLYKSFRPDVALIRGTAADPLGNITSDNEAIRMENFEGAMAARNSGGIVIAQVEKLLDEPANPHHVFVPGVLVDYVVVAQTEEAHPQTLFSQNEPALSGRERVDLSEAIQPMPLDAQKVICRRAAMELCPGMNINLGIGIPMDVAKIAFEEGMLGDITLNTEIGVFGGLPEGGKNFGPAKNPSAFISQAAMFDFYDGGGLDLSCVGMAQVDGGGNVNVSKFGPRVVGCGGFINITQSARKVVFCGAFTASGFRAEIRDGALHILEEGKINKFINAVEQITFSGHQARKDGANVIYVTERCVFRLAPEGLKIIEIAPGIDLQKDILERMDFMPIVPDEIPLMPAALFREETMNLLENAAC